LASNTYFTPLGELKDAVKYVFDANIQFDVILEWLYVSWDEREVYEYIAAGNFQGISQADMVEDALSNLPYWMPDDKLAGISYREIDYGKRRSKR